MDEPLDFFVGQLAIGMFTSGEYPATTGWHPYEPYRGEGHAKLQRTLQEPDCVLDVWYPKDGQRIRFQIDAVSFDLKRPMNQSWMLRIYQFTG